MSEGMSKCPRCGGELEYNRVVEQQVREGSDVALVRVRADVCMRCGERLFNPQMTARLAKARRLLKAGVAKKAIGCVYDLSDEPELRDDVAAE
jgi:YgiT-type zinc finger domain-containing protein